MKKHQGWTRDQLLIALRLYMRMPFGKLHRQNPEIIELAKVIGRTPDALGMKACNFASIDPKLDRKGLSGASKADRAIWDEFVANPESLAAEAEEAFERLGKLTHQEVEKDIVLPVGETEVTRFVRARRVQSFFRDAVLVSYNHRCAVSGIALPELLVASHIIPWSKSVERRADPTNGLCLNALFDRAFDRGLITIDKSMNVMVSKRLEKVVSNLELQCSLLEAHGHEIYMPKRFKPDPEALAYHRDVVFVQ
jgi:putative restriction endonuclease